MRSLSLSLALVPFLLPTARAQTVLHTFNEAEAGAGAGDAVAIWDDLNGDGFLEWVVGAPGQNSNGADAGHHAVEFYAFVTVVRGVLRASVRAAKAARSTASELMTETLPPRESFCV